MVILATVGDFDDVEGVAYYEISVTNESGRQWRVEKRYNEFKELDQQIGAEAKLSRLELPKSGRFGIRKTLRMNAFMEARKEGLDQYLKHLCSQVHLLAENEVLHRFLQEEFESTLDEIEEEPWRESVRPIPAVDELPAEPPTRTGSKSVLVTGSKHKLANVYEHRVIKAGILQSLKAFVVQPEVDVSQMPCRPDGSPALLASSREFLRRLLAQEIKFEGSMKSDISAAQPDLKRLSLEQLLSIRSETLDFATESTSHTAHTSFLTAVDKHLYEKLARRMLRAGAARLPEQPKPLMTLGYQAILRLGAAFLLQQGWSTPPTQGSALNSSKEVPQLEVAVPDLWAIPLDTASWDGCCLEGPCSLVLMSIRENWLQLIPGDPPNLDVVEEDEHVAVVADQSTGRSKQRLLHWVVHVLDPMAESFVAEMNRAEQPAVATKALSSELSTALKKRATEVAAADVAEPE